MTAHVPTAPGGHGRSERSDVPASLSFRIHGMPIAVMFAAVVVGWSAEALAQRAAQLPMLLSPPVASRAASGHPNAQGQDLAVARQRPVAIDFRFLDPRSGDAGTRIGVELFDGQVLTLDLDRVEQRGPGNYTWYGRIPGQNTGHTILTVVDGQMAGSIVLFDAGVRSGTTYQIQSGPNGTASLRQVDPTRFPPDHPPGAERLQATPARITGPAADAGSQTSVTGADATSASADSGSTIDVMVVYSNQTATAAGTSIGAQIQQAVDTANVVYANSGIATRLRLVHFEPANYDESGAFNTDLSRLTTAGDGYMDNVPALRDNYGADLVSLFIENAQYCGIAWIGPSANYAFSVINRGCASGNYSFAHELGHNFGARHDPYVDASTSPYAYGHGLTDPALGWRTVMAYNDACAAAGTSCRRIPYFSNPNLTYGTPPAPLGTTSTSDNARVHNDNIVVVANFRPSAGGCTYALSPTGASIDAAAASGSSSVTSEAGCAWNSLSSAAWLTIGAGTATSGSGQLNYSAMANAGPARSGTITVGNQAFTVSQATGCTYTLSPSSANVAAGGGTSSITLTTGAACPWSASSSATWLTLTSATSGAGNATVAWSVTANTGAQRSANLTVGGITFTVTQAATATTSPAVATLNSSTLSFGNQKVGTTSAAKNVTLINSGGGTLNIASMTSGGANPGDFTLGGTCTENTALAGAQSCTLQYTFTPSAKGTRSATLAVLTSGGAVNLSLSGRGR